MIFMGGFGKSKAIFFAIMGIVFIVIGLMSPSIIRTTFIIIGVSDLVVAGFAYWMARNVESKLDPNQQPGMPQPGQVPGQGGNWVS